MKRLIKKLLREEEYSGPFQLKTSVHDYDDLDFYSTEGHEFYDKMDWKFVEEYIDLV